MPSEVNEKQETSSRMRRRFNWRRLVRFPLWLLLLLVIPAAFVAKHFVKEPDIVYSEIRSDIYEDGDLFLDFKNDQNGVVINCAEDVGSRFTSLGISFELGVPSGLPVAQNNFPLYSVRVSEQTNSAEKDNLSIDNVDSKFAASRKSQWSIDGAREFIGLPERAYIASAGKLLSHKSVGKFCSNTIGPLLPKHKKEDFVGISMLDPNLDPSLDRSIWVAMAMQGRFRGVTTVVFHKPNKPNKPNSLRGVSRFGFFASYLYYPETLEVRCYSPDGRFLCRQSNLSTGRNVFMGFKSNMEIGWIEIEGVGPQKGYTFGGLSFGGISE